MRTATGPLATGNHRTRTADYNSRGYPPDASSTITTSSSLPVPSYRSPQVRVSGRLQTNSYDFPAASCSLRDSPQVRFAGRLQTDSTWSQRAGRYGPEVAQLLTDFICQTKDSRRQNRSTNC